MYKVAIWYPPSHPWVVSIAILVVAVLVALKLELDALGTFFECLVLFVLAWKLVAQPLRGWAKNQSGQVSTFTVSNDGYVTLHAIPDFPPRVAISRHSLVTPWCLYLRIDCNELQTSDAAWLFRWQVNPRTFRRLSRIIRSVQSKG